MALVGYDPSGVLTFRLALPSAARNRLVNGRSLTMLRTTTRLYDRHRAAPVFPSSPDRTSTLLVNGEMTSRPIVMTAGESLGRMYVAARPPYMHDGRFQTLERLGLSAEQRAAIVPYLGTFTNVAFLHDERFSYPFDHAHPKPHR